MFSKPVASERAPHGSVDRAALIQRQYYTDAAAQYDEMHAHDGAGDHKKLGFVRALLHMIEPGTLLLGAGTDRGLRYFCQSMPALLVRGIESVAALIERTAKNETPQRVIIQEMGEAPPFKNARFDVVCSLAIPRHVPRPNAVVREWAEQLRLVSCEPCKASNWLHPLLASVGLIVCSLREPH